MSELKTLKDLFPHPEGTPDEVIREILKAEAIKWVKSLRGNFMSHYGQEDILMEFFNITEDNLKVTGDLK